MYLLALYIVGLSLYFALLLWCLAPVMRISDSYKPNWFRVSAGFLLLAANILPPLAWPLIFPARIFFEHRTTERLMAIPLFVRTLPAYILNLTAWSYSTATFIEAAYPFEIGGVKYRPILQMGCTSRRMVSIDKAVSIHFFSDFPTLSGGELVSRDRDATIVIDQPHGICSMVKRGQLSSGSYPPLTPGPGPVLYVIRGKDDNTQLYELRYRSYINIPVGVDDIVFQPPEIIRVEERPTRQIVSLDALWPMKRPGEQSGTPLIVEVYRRLPSARFHVAH